MKKEFTKEQINQIFNKYTKKFLNEITNLNSIFKLYDQLFDYRDEINKKSDFMILVYSSFSKDIILTLSKFYENKFRRNKSDYSIIDYLNLCEIINNSEVDFFIYGDISNKIKEHKKRIEDMENTIKNLLTWRDKKICHFDKEPFLDKNFLIEKAPLSKKELENLKKIVIDILNTYFYAYSGKIHICKLKSIDNLNLEKIINVSKNNN